MVGVTHECDWPPEAAAKPVVTASLIQTGDLSSARSTGWSPRRRGTAGRSTRSRRSAGRRSRPTSSSCRSSATSAPSPPTRSKGVLQRASARRRGARLLALDVGGHRGDDSRDRGAARCRGGGRGAGGRDAEPRSTGSPRRSPASRRRRASSSPSGSSRRTRPGTGSRTWSATAGGIDVAGMSGEPSHRMRWPDVAALEPDVVVLAPCGFDLDRTLSEVVPLDLSAHLLGTPARQESAVFAVDANAMFSRPEPAGRRRRRADGAPAPSGRVPGSWRPVEPRAPLAGLVVEADPQLSVRRARSGSGWRARRRRGMRPCRGRSATRGTRTRARRRGLRRPTSGLPSCGQALSKACTSPPMRRTTILRSPASTTARSPAKASAGTWSQRTFVA